MRAAWKGPTTPELFAKETGKPALKLKRKESPMSDPHVGFPFVNVNERALCAALNALADFERVFEAGLNSLAETVETLPHASADPNEDLDGEGLAAALVNLELAFEHAAAALRQTLAGAAGRRQTQ
jgi:hypothetical protein